MQVVPEYESCHEAAERAGVSVREVHIAGWVGASPKLESPTGTGKALIMAFLVGSRDTRLETWRRFAGVSPKPTAKYRLPRRLHRTHCQC